VDFWQENEAKRWANAYDFPAVEDGRITREEPDNLYRSSGVLVGFIPNLRREKFSDPRVRQALNLAYDFEEQNRTLFFEQYERINSFFYGTELASSGLPQGRELEILERCAARFRRVFSPLPMKIRSQAIRQTARQSPQGRFAVPGSRLHSSRQPDGERRNRRTVHIRDHSEWTDHREGGASLYPEPQAHWRRRLGSGSRLLAIYQPVALAGFRHDLFRLGADTLAGQ
jgi:hypothetical protein